MATKKIILYVYNSFKDPLFRNLMLTYVKDLADPGQLEFYIITFEQEVYKMSPDEIQKTHEDLAPMGITWMPQAYHSGKFILLKKMWDAFQTFIILARLRFQKKAKIVFAFNVAAAYSWFVKKLFGFKMIIFSFEPHSDFLAELGLWSERSLSYKILNRLEWHAGMHAEYVLTGTKHMVEKLTEMGAQGEVHRAPTGVDETIFYPTPESQALRTRFGLDQKKILFYIGKFGGLYYDREIVQFFKQLQKQIDDLHFYIITPSSLDQVKTYFDQLEIQPTDYTLTASTLSVDEVNIHIGIADICLSAVPPSPSQKYRSPTKVGEYLMCGKPYITSIGVSEDDLFAMERKVGVVLPSFEKEEVDRAVPNIVQMIKKSGSMSSHCRAVGIEYRSKKNVTKILSRIFKEI